MPSQADLHRSRMRVLSILSSSNQMYSGIGRCVFELARRLADRVAFEFAIDDGTPRNTELVIRFGREHGMPVHVGGAAPEPDSLDLGNADLPELLRQSPGRWDLVECLGWANAATNAALLDALPDRTPLVYTPHDQPTWTVPMTPEQAARTTGVHRRVLQRADVVCCDSPVELNALQAQVRDRCNAAFLPLGCDFAAFAPAGPERREQLLFVGDLAEPRKRFDRVLDLFGRLRAVRPGLRLVVIGNRSDEAGASIPAESRQAIELRGYVGEAELRRAYAESLGLVLLSDYEAFGIPILESLAAGTPVFLSRQPTTESLFGAYRGAHFCPADDPEATFAIIRAVLDRGAAAP